MSIYPRTGLRIRCDKEVDREVRRACIEFVRWLRTQMDFPIRVVIYLKKDYIIKTKITKETATATFFAPFTHQEEPYIRIATGDYEELLSRVGKDRALAANLTSIAHEITHYRQWLIDPMDEMIEEEAEDGADDLVALYAQTREHP